jgi:hypothetical protein
MKLLAKTKTRNVSLAKAPRTPRTAVQRCCHRHCGAPRCCGQS